MRELNNEQYEFHVEDHSNITKKSVNTLMRRFYRWFNKAMFSQNWTNFSHLSHMAWHEDQMEMLPFREWALCIVSEETITGGENSALIT